MKCPMCGGDGITDKFTPNVGRCIKCNGTGEIEVTNEEWLKSCNTNELAEFFNKLAYSLYTNQNRMTCEDDWIRWLKEIHK